MNPEYTAVQITDTLWMVHWYKPELAGNAEEEDRFVETEVRGNFSTKEAAITAAIKQGSWA
jgi:hypothetical protein